LIKKILKPTIYLFGAMYAFVRFLHPLVNDRVYWGLRSVGTMDDLTFYCEMKIVWILLLYFVIKIILTVSWNKWKKRDVKLFSVLGESFGFCLIGIVLLGVNLDFSPALIIKMDNYILVLKYSYLFFLIPLVMAFIATSVVKVIRVINEAIGKNR